MPRQGAPHEGQGLILFYFVVYIVYSHFSLAVLTYHGQKRLRDGQVCLGLWFRGESIRVEEAWQQAARAGH